MRPHVIRLRGPWHYRPIARSVLLANGVSRDEPGELPPPGQIKLPGDWGQTLGVDFRGRVAYTRRFGRPTGLASGQRVELVIEQVDAMGRVTLNGQWLGEAGVARPARFRIGRLLQPRNELTVEVELPRLTNDSPSLPRPGREALPGGLVGEVRLEIHPAAGER